MCLERKRKLVWVEALRGYGALLVVLVHSVAEFKPLGWITESRITDFLSNGGRAVQLFFIISGFVMFLSLSKNEINGKKDYFIYLLRRYVRLLFPFILVAIICIIVGKGYSFQTHVGGGYLKIDWICFLVTIAGFFGFSPYYISGIVPNGWYVGIIWMYCIIAPLIYRHINSLSRSIKFLFCAFILRLATHGITLFFTLPGIIEYWFDMFITNQLVFISIGQVFYYVLVKRDKKSTGVDQLMLLVMLIYASTLFDSLMFWGLIMGAFFLCLSFPTDGSLLVNKGIVFLGKYSYEIYLTHFFAIMMVKFLPLGSLGGYTSFFIGYGLTVFLSIIFAVLLKIITKKPIELNCTPFVRHVI